MPPNDMPPENTVPLFWEHSFVRLTGSSSNGTKYEGVSVTPEVVGNNDLSTKAVFPLVVSTAQISAPEVNLYSLPVDLGSQVSASDGVKFDVIPVPVSKISSDTTSDGLFGTATLSIFGPDADPTSEIKRANTLGDPNFRNSDVQLWPASTIGVRQ